MPEGASKVVWVVVKVERGIPVDARAFRRAASAIKSEQSLRKGMNTENDETGVFRVSVC
jgi:hypothetical protein